jgi:hypothetical protein
MWYQATIIIVSKRKSNECGNNCGINILNIEYKVYGELTSSKIQNNAGVALLENQNGFLRDQLWEIMTTR